MRTFLSHLSTTEELLLRRGFLLERRDGKVFLSDNAHPDDATYLTKIMERYALGQLGDGDELIFSCDLDVSNGLEELFVEIPRRTVGVGSCNRMHNWKTVKCRYYADKVPVKWLEANVAYYIKALSACGIFTGGCCDGNHPGSSDLYIEFDTPAYRPFHKLIWTEQLDNMFDVAWNDTHDAVDLSVDKQRQYDNLFLAADYLYNNRFYYQRVRMRAAEWIKRSDIKRNSGIEERFLEEAKKLLKEV